MKVFQTQQRTVVRMTATLAAGILLFCAARARAVDYTWQNAGGGDWTADTNWDQSGQPDSAGDTAFLGNLSGPYTATLNASRTIGGLTLQGADPTLQVDGTLIQSGGTSTVSGGTLTGSGTVQWQDGAAITWSSATAPAGALVFRVPVGTATPMATLDNSDADSAWGIGQGQELRIEGEWTNNTTARVFSVSHGFSNSGLIQLGSNSSNSGGWGFPAPNVTLTVTNGTLTNTADGEIVLYPRNNDGSGAQGAWSERFLNLELNNAGSLTSYAVGNTALGRAGANHANSGTITVDGSLTGGGRAFLAVTGTSLSNTGTIDLNDGILAVRTDTFTHSAGSITGNGILRLGRHVSSTTTEWTGPDTTAPLTFQIAQNALHTLNRNSAWDLAQGQTLTFEILGGNGPTEVTLNQDLNNSGLIQMGLPAPGDWYGIHILKFSAGRLTNNADGIINMYPRSATSFSGSFGYSWSHREIRGEVINDGQFNVYSWASYIGKAGAAHENNGTIVLDSSITEANGQYATLNVTGTSFTNNSGGVIAGVGTIDVTGVAGGLVNDGTLAPGMSIGTLSVNGDLILTADSYLDFEYDAGGTSDLIAVAGNLTLNGSLNGAGAVLGETYTIFTYTGSLTDNGLNVTGLPAYLRAEFDTTGGQVTFMAIPEPTTAILLALGALGLLRRRRL